MNRASPALWVLVSVVTSCSAPTSPQAQEGAAAAACPSQDFGTFLTAFANEPGVQESFTRRPLHFDYIDAAADPEPKRVTRMLDGAALEFPLLPSLPRQKQDGLEMRWNPNGNDKAEVVLSKPDTDYLRSFFFIRNGCWMLERIKDDSL